MLTLTIALLMLASATLSVYTWHTLLVAPRYHQRLCDLECALGRLKPGDYVPGGLTTDRWDRVLTDVMRLRRGVAS